MSSTTDLVHRFKLIIKQKDGTSKFVALFLLLQILSERPDAAPECWNCLDPGFLDKLILSRENKATSVGEAQDLRAMGCAILHAYASMPEVNLLSSFSKRSNVLMKVYIRSAIQGDQLLQVGQTLCSMAASREGAVNIISNESFLKFVQKCLADDWPLGISCITLVVNHALTIESVTADLFHESIREVIALVSQRLSTDKSSFSLFRELFTSVATIVPTERLTDFLKSETMDLVRQAVSHDLFRPSKDADHGEILVLTASLMRSEGHEFLLRNIHSQEDQRLFVLVASLAASEIRSSLAWLCDHVHDPTYHSVALKVASCYDILRIVCLYLVTTEDLVLKADDILKIRDNFSAAFTETMSYLRDRWDQSPLCPTSAWHVGGHVLAAASDFDLPQDPTIISGTQSLGLWLQEDESSHKDACGIMDVFLGLLVEGKKSRLEFGTWLVPAIAALIESEDGMKQFLAYKGLTIITSRLNSVSENVESTETAHIRDAENDLDVLRIASPERAERWERSHRDFVARIDLAR